MKGWGWLIAGVLVVVGCKSEPPWKWNLPSHFPEPKVPTDNPMSAAKVHKFCRMSTWICTAMR